MIDKLVELVMQETAGDPMGGLLWTYRSLAKLAAELSLSGARVSSATVGKWLKSLGYSLHVNRKALSRTQPRGRDDQFAHRRPAPAMPGPAHPLDFRRYQDMLS